MNSAKIVYKYFNTYPKKWERISKDVLTLDYDGCYDFYINTAPGGFNIGAAVHSFIERQESS